MEGGIGNQAVFGSNCSHNQTILHIINLSAGCKTQAKTRDLFIRHQLKPLGWRWVTVQITLSLKHWQENVLTLSLAVAQRWALVSRDIRGCWGSEGGVQRNRINRDRCGDGVGRRLLGTPFRCYISKWGSGETVFLVEINSSLQINMGVWSAHFDFSLSPSFPCLLPSFLSFLLPSFHLCNKYF